MTNREADGEVPGAVHAVVAAFLDGEDVDARALERALAEPEGREYLVDVLMLRLSVQATFEAPGSAPPQTSNSRGGRLAAVAAALIVALGSGYLVGVHRQASLDRDSTISPVMVDFSQLASVPSPTRVIELEPGLNWKDEGGN